ncbi:acyl-CoA dehydrogenase family protein [Sphingomonas sp.]|uniref:acyl-CoA dehydrogenase family protein n=1 Tax=Sphingomonas sp. TaxID=28214 RepID=UPI0017E14EC7|nr:acyl-CoA dehydrogenase family protein [Sphingomonas sp.]MBA4763142.1 acyl-CoA dehydrogenase family protein [Sphingomonas sp.]
MIDFKLDPAFETKLEWVRDFVRDYVDPLDALFDNYSAPYDHSDAAAIAALRPLQAEVRRQGLWGMHLPPELGGPGFGQVELCFLNEILGRTHWGPTVFGCQAPDSGNAEILARFGTAEHKERYLKPLLENEIVSCFSMTEVEGGSDPTQFTCKAEFDGTHWVINGEKWFSSNARFAEFLIVMVVTDPDAPIYDRMSTIIVPRDAPGLEFIAEPGVAGEPYDEGSHAHLRYTNVRVPADNLLGERGGGFKVAQSRLGGGRIHHAMRVIGMCERALDMMCERALSRHTKGERLADKQLVQVDIGQSWIELEQFRLLVLRTAWMFDNHMEAEARAWIAACKVACAKIAHDIIFRAMHLLGSLGVSNYTPLGRMWANVLVMGMADGPTEIHQMYAARHLLRKHKAAPGRFPTDYIPELRRQAQEKFAQALELAE